MRVIVQISALTSINAHCVTFKFDDRNNFVIPKNTSSIYIYIEKPLTDTLT